MSRAGRILIADDEPVFLGTTAELLELRGYECDCVGEAAEATEKLRRHRFDLLISDIRMPGNLELEFINGVDQLAPGLPVILVTAHPSVQTAVDSLRLPVVDYLLKPIDFDELMEKVDKSVADSQVRRRANDAKRHLDGWCQDLTRFRSLLDEPEECTPESVNAFVNLNLKNVADTLVKFGTLVDDMMKGPGEPDAWQLIASAQLDIAFNAMNETIRALKETKHLVKSKRLAKLRHKLQVLVDEWPRRPSGAVDRPSEAYAGATAAGPTGSTRCLTVKRS